MARVAERMSDKRLLKLIRAFLNVGTLEDGLVRSNDGEGVPQGGPLSPLLSNLYLDALDRELEARGHRFVRYADDVNIYVRSERAGDRVMTSVSHFIEKKLKLRVNRSKSAVDKPIRRKFLGFSLTGGKKPKRLVAGKSKQRFKQKVREMTRRHRGKSFARVVDELTLFLRGWAGYYGHCDTLPALQAPDSWVRRRLRCLLWYQWKTPRNRWRKLRRGGVPKRMASIAAASRKGPWRMSQSPSLNQALSNTFFDSLGLPRVGRVIDV